MFDSLRRMFGEGVVHFTAEFTDGSRATGKIPYIGVYDEGEVRHEIRERCRVNHNKIVAKINITAHQSR